MPNAPEIKERMRVRRKNLTASQWQKRVDGKRCWDFTGQRSASSAKLTRANCTLKTEI
jgi:hypothetical protein